MTKHRSWESKMGSLRRYHAAHGNCLVPYNYIDNQDNGFKLGSWVGVLRSGRIQFQPQQLAELNALGFVWRLREMPGKKISWAQKLEILRRYKARHGDCNVKDGYIDPESGLKLGLWVCNMRRLGRDGKLDEARVADLEQLGGFEWGKSVKDRWRFMYNLLLQYRAEHPEDPFPNNHRLTYQGRQLGQWIQEQRKAFRRNQQRDTNTKGAAVNRFLKPEHQALLDEISFTWNLEAPKKNAKQYMTRPAPHVIHGDTTAEAALEYMVQNHLAAVPVVVTTTMTSEDSNETTTTPQQPAAPLAALAMTNGAIGGGAPAAAENNNNQQPQQPIFVGMLRSTDFWRARNVTTTRNEGGGASMILMMDNNDSPNKNDLGASRSKKRQKRKPKGSLLVSSTPHSKKNKEAAEEYVQSARVIRHGPNNSSNNSHDNGTKGNNPAATTTDTAAAPAPQQQQPTLLVRHIMNPNPLRVTPETSMSLAASLFAQQQSLEIVPVVNATTNELEGILTAQNCLQDLLFVVRNLPTTTATTASASTVSPPTTAAAAPPPTLAATNTAITTQVQAVAVTTDNIMGHHVIGGNPVMTTVTTATTALTNTDTATSDIHQNNKRKRDDSHDDDNDDPILDAVAAAVAGPIPAGEGHHHHHHHHDLEALMLGASSQAGQVVVEDQPLVTATKRTKSAF